MLEIAMSPGDMLNKHFLAARLALKATTYDTSVEGAPADRI